MIEKETYYNLKNQGETSDDHHHHHHQNASKSSSNTTSWSRFKDPRIVRVSKALGGNRDRHSKVCTVRGLRDRRVRLSVPTAIQLYHLQERLGLNQPSKVVDWLLNAAKHEIDQLPPLQGENLFNFQEFRDFYRGKSKDDDEEDRNENNWAPQYDIHNNFGLLLPLQVPTLMSNVVPSPSHHHHHHHHQVDVYHHQPGLLSTQSYFPSQIDDVTNNNGEFNPKQQVNFQSSSQLSTSSLRSIVDSTSQSHVRPDHFNMTCKSTPFTRQ